ncbi:Hypothetical protein BPA_0067101 [Borrelia parkeri SLO]|uniref:Uncharacterized protein n=1 Tax=Borrelia parkeri SLO TaxID=1313294 RepID=A0ABM5PKS5_BORPR|nr:Hypothetical protein BPA_0067101 [Borrelia parkeri SLO]
MVYTDNLFVIEKLRNAVEMLDQAYPTEEIRFFVIDN